MLPTLGSRLSFPAAEPQDLRKGFWRVSEGVPEGVSEGSLKGPRTCQPKDPSKRLPNAFENPLKPFQEGVEIDEALGFLGHKNLVCSKPSLKIVKEFLRFSLSRPGHWEDNNTKNHEERPKKSLTATNRRLVANKSAEMSD